MNWYHVIKLANFQLGQSLGKWLVLQWQGKFDPSSFQSDMALHVHQDPTAMNFDDARSTAVAYFTQQTGQQPGPDQQNILNQWLTEVGGNGQQDVMTAPVGAVSINGGLENV